MNHQRVAAAVGDALSVRRPCRRDDAAGAHRADDAPRWAARIGYDVRVATGGIVPLHKENLFAVGRPPWPPMVSVGERSSQRNHRATIDLPYKNPHVAEPARGVCDEL